MSKESAVRFLEKARENERVIEALKSRETAWDIEEIAKLLAETAAGSGEDIQAEDFAEALEEIEAAVRRKTDAVVSDMEAIDDEELKNVAGGGCDWFFTCSQDFLNPGLRY